jgi:hypothetical protein
MNIIDFFGKPLNPMETEEEPDYNKNIDSLIRENTPTEQGLLGYTEPYTREMAPPTELGPISIPYGPQQEIPGQGLPLMGVGGRKPFSRLGSIISKWWNRGNNEGPEFLGNAPMDKVNEQLGKPPVY